VAEGREFVGYLLGYGVPAWWSDQGHRAADTLVDQVVAHGDAHRVHGHARLLNGEARQDLPTDGDGDGRVTDRLRPGIVLPVAEVNDLRRLPVGAEKPACARLLWDLQIQKGRLDAEPSQRKPQTALIGAQARPVGLLDEVAAPATKEWPRGRADGSRRVAVWLVGSYDNSILATVGLPREARRGVAPRLHGCHDPPAADL